MNKWRHRPEHAVKKADSTFGELTDDADVANAADSVYTEAEKHRAGVIARDKAARARRKGGRRG